MNLLVYEGYGPPGVLQLKEVEKPTPKDDEVPIRVYATSVTAADHRTPGHGTISGFLYAKVRFLRR